MSLAFHNMFARLDKAPIVAPRGERTKEICGSQTVIRTDEDVWAHYPSRKLSLAYVCTEMLWYLRADNGDTSIGQHAKIWRDLMARGILQSNYGAYMFREGQFARCVEELRKDPWSRRASIVILRPDHFHTNSADIPCTYAQNFRVRDGRLEMSVHMRSNDVWFGAGNDIPIFRFVQHMMARALGLNPGPYVHNVDSLHVYERHWDAMHRCLYEDTLPIIFPSPERPMAMIEQMMTNPAGKPVDAFHAWLQENAYHA